MSASGCPKCGGAMVPGFATSANTGASNSYTQPEIWVEGPPERSLWTGSRVKDKQHYTIVATRCNRCGFLELYAPPQPEG